MKSLIAIVILLAAATMADAATQTGDLTGPNTVSAAERSAWDAKADASTVAAHTSRTDNPHATTKTQVGLGNVDNTADAAKPVSTAQASALALKQDAVSGKGLSTEDFTTALKSKLDAVAAGATNLSLGTTSTTAYRGDYGAAAYQHVSNTSNPHSTTASQVGLGNVENKSSATIRGETTAANVTTALGFTPVTDARTVNGHALTGNVSVTKSDVGLGNADNTSDASKPVSTATQTALDLKANSADTATDTELAAHVANTSNPHSTTKAQVGLGNVDNTSDANKPVSTAQATAIGLKADAVSGKGLSTEDFTTALKNKLDAVAAGATNLALGTTSSTAYRGDYGNTAYQHVSSTSNPHNTTKAQVGLTNAEDKSSATIRGEITSGNVTTALGYTPATNARTINGHALTADVTVTKSDVSLGNCDNTADASKPVSTAQQTALDSKAPLASPTFTGTVSGISKSMVGLGNVDNTSDAAKPVSAATQTALDAKASTVAATTSANGLMGSADKAKLDGIASGLQGYAANNAVTASTTLALAHNAGCLVVSGGSGIVVTIPTNASVAFPVGSEVGIVRSGSSSVMITAATGVTLQGVSAGNCSISNQYGLAVVKKIGGDAWIVAGAVGDVVP